MTLGLNRNKNILTKNGSPIGVERQGQTMPPEFIDLNSPPVVTANRDKQKAMGKEKWHRRRSEKSTKNDNRVQKEKKKTKWKSSLKSINNQNVSSYYGKNWKVITIYLIIVTVILEIIVKIIIMLMNKDNNK